jgi:malonyl CoA-acyl carrier protein transacylase
VLLKTYKKEVYLAMKNCPNQLVIYVLNDKLAEVKNRLSEERAMAFQLYTDHAYHTPFYSKQAKEVRNIYANLSLTKAATTLYSCVDAMPFPEDREMIVDKAIAQWVNTVKFEDTINKLYSEGYNTFIEVGPNNKLTNFVRDTLKNKPVVILNTNLPEKDNFNTFSELCALLWINGVNASIDFFNSDTKKTEKEIPTQIDVVNKTTINNNEKVLIFKKHQELMQHFLQVQEQSWNMFKEEIQKRQNPQLRNNIEFIPSHFPLLAKYLSHANGKMYIEKQYDLHSYPFFKDHAMGEKLAVIAFTVSLEITAEAALYYAGSQFKVTGIENVSGHSWLALENGKIDIGIEVNAIGTNKTEVVIYELNKTNGNKKKAFEATVILSPNYTIAPSYQPLLHNEKTISLKPAANFYTEDLFHGPYYTGIEKVTNLNSKEITAIMHMPVLKEAFSKISNPVFQIPAALLDCSGQLAAYWLMSHNTRDFAVFPFSMKSYRQFALFPAEGSALKCDVKISRMQSIVEAQFCYYDNENKLLAQIEGFKLMLYQHPLIPAILMNTLQQEQTEQLLTPEFLLEAGGIWGRALAAIILDKKEYENWLALAKIENQIDYLINNIQNKSLTI